MTDPRPNNEPRSRVEPQESQQPIPGTLVRVIAFALGAAWLAIFVVRLANGGAPNWLNTWWLLVAGVAFVAVGADRLRRALGRRG